MQITSALRRRSRKPAATATSSASRGPTASRATSATSARGSPTTNSARSIRDAYKSLLHAVEEEKDFDQITLGLGRKLTNPQAGLATDPEGPDPKNLKILAAPSLDSAEEAAEAVELYWMALLRDVPFAEFTNNNLVETAAATSCRG